MKSSAPYRKILAAGLLWYAACMATAVSAESESARHAAPGAVDGRASGSVQERRVMIRGDRVPFTNLKVRSVRETTDGGGASPSVEGGILLDSVFAGAEGLLVRGEAVSPGTLSEFVSALQPRPSELYVLLGDKPRTSDLELLRLVATRNDIPTLALVEVQGGSATAAPAGPNGPQLRWESPVDLRPEVVTRLRGHLEYGAERTRIAEALRTIILLPAPDQERVMSQLCRQECLSRVLMLSPPGAFTGAELRLDREYGRACANRMAQGLSCVLWEDVVAVAVHAMSTNVSCTHIKFSAAGIGDGTVCVKQGRGRYGTEVAFIPFVRAVRCGMGLQLRDGHVVSDDLSLAVDAKETGRARSVGTE